MRGPVLPPRAAPVFEKPLPFSDESTSEKFTLHWFGWFKAVQGLFDSGFTGTITTAALTGGGSNGSMTFQNGALVSQTPAT